MFNNMSECTKEICFVYPLLYFDLGLNLENYIGLGDFSILFWYKITSFQTGQEEMKEKDILLT